MKNVKTLPNQELIMTLCRVCKDIGQLKSPFKLPGAFMAEEKRYFRNTVHADLSKIAKICAAEILCRMKQVKP